MKLIHLSDLHLGIRVNEYSMIEDQKYILKQIIDIIDEQKPNAVIIAGDIYDKAVPSAEAVVLFDDFLARLAQRKLKVFIISGNHDSPERTAFGSRIMRSEGIYISPVYDGNTEPVTLEDEYGAVDFFMLPFIRPANVRRFFENAEISDCNDAVKCAVENMDIKPDRRNVLIMHQFVTGASSRSEDSVYVGGLDNVDAALLAPFDYTALGHIHSPQNCGTERIRYCGTPLKYSFSEADDKKSITVVDLAEKGNLHIDTVELKPLRDVVQIKGTYEEITLRSFYEKTTWQEDYTHITLTDEEDIPDAVGKLRAIYHNIMKLDYDNKRTRESLDITALDQTLSIDPFELFAQFYRLRNNSDMNDEQAALIKKMIDEIWSDEQ